MKPMMAADTEKKTLVRQHLIAPGTCIRCNTCESRCPTKAISHQRNYVVDPEKCNFCMRCVRPCPTGAVEHFFHVAQLYLVDERLRWIELPSALQAASPTPAVPAPSLQPNALRGNDSGGLAAVSAAMPDVNVFTSDDPARLVVGRQR
jgi:benzoyl-CoA 2,3-epoxidase subunit A